MAVAASALSPVLRRAPSRYQRTASSLCQGSARRQKRPFVTKGPERMSTVKRMENLASTSKVSMSLEQAFRRQRNRMLKKEATDETDGALPLKEHEFESIVAAWAYVPSETKKRIIVVDGDNAQMHEIMVVLHETGALRKSLRIEQDNKQKAEREAVDEAVTRAVLMGIVAVIALTYASIHSSNQMQRVHPAHPHQSTRKHGKVLDADIHEDPLDAVRE
ncbi:hypothetical protein DIPPA_60631 [Diplonema papillatum]|nr:hypothetical protein DIPPA_60631 [Diplonema papillatum]